MEEENVTEEPKTEESKEVIEETEETTEEIKESAETLEKEEEVEGAVEEAEEAPLPVEEVEPPSMKELEEDIVEERIYTIPLGKAWIAPPKKRAPRAVRIIKDFVKRHMKFEVERSLEEDEEPKRLIISNEVNERVWRRSIGKPPRKVRVRAAKDKEGNITVYLAEGD